MESPNLNTNIIPVNNCFLKQPTECKFTHKLDEKIILDYEYVIYFANGSSKNEANEANEANEINKISDLQFCCFMNLKFKSHKDNVFTFDGSVSYGMCYWTNIFKMELVWNKTNNTYYLNDLIHNLNLINYIQDKNNFILISGSDIVRHFFKNPPKFLPKSTFLEKKLRQNTF